MAPSASGDSESGDPLPEGPGVEKGTREENAADRARILEASLDKTEVGRAERSLEQEELEQGMDADGCAEESGCQAVAIGTSSCSELQELRGTGGAAGPGSLCGATRSTEAEAGAKPGVIPENYETVFTNAKAGMEGVDKEAVKRVVYEMSQGSRFFAAEERRDVAVRAKVEALLQAKARMGAAQLQQLQAQAAKHTAELEASRCLTRTWMHVDMDAFYAAVEILENPSLQGKPLAVGGMSMICTASYEARKFGVRAAMPGFIGKRLCPDLVFVKPDFQKYQRYSEMTRQVFREYDPSFVARSMDEAYLDITDACQQRNMSGGEVAEEIRARVTAATSGLTCSAGIAANRLLAKVCSDMNKPNGQFVLPAERQTILEFMSSLSIRKVCGIGRVTERLLKEAVGITECGQLVSEAPTLFGLFSQLSAEFFLAVGLGIGGAESVVEEARKSVSCERTFGPLSQLPALLDKLEAIASSLAEDLEELGLRGRTLTLKLKSTDFKTVTRAVSLESPVGTKEDMMPHAIKLLKAEMPLSLRLMGLRVSNLVSVSEIAGAASHGRQTTLDRFLSHRSRKARQGQSSPARPQDGAADSAMNGRNAGCGPEWVREGEGQQAEMLELDEEPIDPIFRTTQRVPSDEGDFDQGVNSVAWERVSPPATLAKLADPEAGQAMQSAPDGQGSEQSNSGAPLADSVEPNQSCSESMKCAIEPRVQAQATAGVMEGNLGSATFSLQQQREVDNERRSQDAAERPWLQEASMPVEAQACRQEGHGGAVPVEGRAKEKRGLEGLPVGEDRHSGQATIDGMIAHWAGKRRPSARLATHSDVQAAGASSADMAGCRVEWAPALEGFWRCALCEACVPERARGEHEDYHFALALSCMESRQAEAGGVQEATSREQGGHAALHPWHFLKSAKLGKQELGGKLTHAKRKKDRHKAVSNSKKRRNEPNCA